MSLSLKHFPSPSGYPFPVGKYQQKLQTIQNKMVLGRKIVTFYSKKVMKNERKGSQKNPNSSPFIWGLAFPLFWGRDGAIPAGEPSLSHTVRMQGLPAQSFPPSVLLLPQRPQRCKCPAFILVQGTAREPEQEIPNGTANTGSQQQVLPSALRSVKF